MEKFITFLLAFVCMSTQAQTLAPSSIMDSPVVDSDKAPAMKAASRFEASDADYTDWTFVDHASIFDPLFQNIVSSGLAKGENRFAVYVRNHKSDANLYDLKLQNFLGICDLILHCDRRTYSFTADPAVTNLPGEDGKFDSYGDFTYYDHVRFVIYDSNVDNKVSLEGGNIQMGIFQWCYEDSNRYGPWVGGTTIIFENAPEWTYSAQYKPVLGGNDSEAVITINHTGAAQKFRYNVRKVYKAADTSQEFAFLFGDLDEDAQITDGEIRFSTDDNAPAYYVLVAPLDKDGNYLGFRTITDLYYQTYETFKIGRNIPDTHQWVDYKESLFSPYGLVFDGLENAVFEKFKGMQYPRTIQTRKDAYGRIFRVVNPLASDTPAGQVLAETDGAVLYPDEDYYLVLDMSNPDQSGSTVNVLGASTRAFGLNSPTIAFDDGFYQLNHNRIIKTSNTVTLLELDNVIETDQNSVGSDNTVYINATKDVAKLRYTIEPLNIATTAATEIVEKLADGDASLDYYETDNYTTGTRATNAERTFAIDIPEDIVRQGSFRIIAVPVAESGIVLDYYLEKNFTYEWRNIGKANISATEDFFDTLGFKKEWDVERYGYTGTYRFTNLSENNGFKPLMDEEDYFWLNTMITASCEYLEIDTSAPSDVRLNAFFETGHVTDDGYIYLASVPYLVANGYIAPINYDSAVLVGNTITFPDYNLVLRALTTTSTKYDWYNPSLAITLPDEAGIDNIMINPYEGADINTPVEYYNLQGIRVTNPEHGIYIVRQGTRATKLIK